MKKLAIALVLSATLTACGGKTHLVTQAYMPEPPGVLMQNPKELNTIKQEPQEPK